GRGRLERLEEEWPNQNRLRGTLWCAWHGSNLLPRVPQAPGGYRWRLGHFEVGNDRPYCMLGRRCDADWRFESAWTYPRPLLSTSGSQSDVFDRGGPITRGHRRTPVVMNVPTPETCGARLMHGTELKRS